MSPELSSLPQGTPVWVTVGLVIISALLTFSERAAKLKGPLGAAARRWNNRQLLEIEHKLTVEEAIDKSVEKRVEMKMKPVNCQIFDMEKRIRNLREDLARERADRKRERDATNTEHQEAIRRLKAERDLYVDWSAHLQSWWHPIQMWIASQGLTLPPPPYPSFAEFKLQWERKNKKQLNDNINTDFSSTDNEGSD